MAEDEIDDTLEAPEDIGEPEIEETDAEVEETLEDGRLRWTDGIITDAQGIREEQEPAETQEETRTEPEPAPRATASPTPAPVSVPTPSGRQIYTTEGLEKFIYSDDELQKVADARLLDPLEAERMSARLNTRYNEARDKLRVHANKVFNEGLEAFKKAAPQTVQRFGLDIAQFKETLTPEQLQTEGAAQWVAAQVAAQAFAANPALLEETVSRAAASPPTVVSTPTIQPAKAPTKAQPIPREQRMAGPGSAGARGGVARRRVQQATSGDALTTHYMKLYGISAEEAKVQADWARENDPRAKR